MGMTPSDRGKFELVLHMKTVRLLPIVALLQVAVCAQQPPAVLIGLAGDVSQPRVFQEQDWKALKHVSVSATNEHEKKTAIYSGVTLQQLLRNAGANLGEKLRGKAMATCVVISASDGYQVTFSLAELDEGIGNLQVLVADSEDSKPLAQNAGPLRLVVPTDKRPARWVRMVKTIRVVANPSPASLR